MPDRLGRGRRGGPAVLYITGAGRSGSTLLGQILGQLEGFCFVGELMGGWQTFGDRRCGCLALLGECEFWAAVRQVPGLGAGALEPAELFALGRLARWRYLPLTFGPGPPIAARFGERWWGGQRLYEAVAAVSGARVVVDSSKSVPYARLLSRLPGLDVRFVHLIRDPRAVAHSWSRIKAVPDRLDQGHMNRRRPTRSAVNWVISNAGAELLGRRRPERYLRLRYEDLVARPRASIERIASLAGQSPPALPLTGEHSLALRPTHSVKGNPGRFRSGPTDLRLDDEWQRAMPAVDRQLVTWVTRPLLGRYGYLGGPASPPMPPYAR